LIVPAELIQVRCVVTCFPTRSGPDHVDRAVDRDPVQPGAEIGARFETAQLTVGFQEGLLHHVFRVLRRSCHSMRDPIDGAAVALNQRAKSFAITVAGQRDGGGVRMRHPIA
jgi:hypothetical protein